MAIVLISIAYGSKYKMLGDVKNAKNVYLEFSNYENNEQSYKKVEITDEEDQKYLKNLFGSIREYGAPPCGCPIDTIKITFETNKGDYVFGFGVMGDHNNSLFATGKYIHFSSEEYRELLRFFLKFDAVGAYKEDILKFLEWY